VIDFRCMHSEDEFETMCRQLVCAENPDAIPVEAYPGDESMDAFEGVIDVETYHIWQFKHFPHGIGPSQQDQIRRSLKDAVERHKPRRWTLLTSSDLSPKNLRWLRKQESDFHEVEIQVVCATRLRELLDRFQMIRKQYFPLLDEKTDLLMRMVARSDREGLPRAKILENVRNDIDVLNDNSPHFKYTFLFDENGTRIGAQPRTAEACKMPLMSLRMEFPEDDPEACEALERYRVAMDSGRSVTIPGAFVAVQESVFDQFMGEGRQISQLRIVPKIPDIHVPIRIHASHGDESACIPYVDLRLRRRGKREIEFSNDTDGKTLVRVTLTSIEGSPAILRFGLGDAAGMRPSDVIGIERFIAIGSRRGASMTLESLSSNAKFTSAVEVTGEEIPRERLNFYEALLLIQNELDPDLLLPDAISEDDVAAVLGIRRALRPGEATKQVTASFDVTPISSKQMIELAKAREPITWLTEDGLERFVVFGRTYEFDVTTEMTGPVEILEGSPEQGGIRLSMAGAAHFSYRNGRCADL